MARSLLVVLLVFWLAVLDGSSVRADDDSAKANLWLAKNARPLPGVVESAAKEGSLTLYCLVSSCPQKLIDAFNSAFPFIHVNVYRGPGFGVVEKLRTEISANRGIADIVVNTSAAIGDSLVSQGDLQDWTPPDAGLVPKEWRHPGMWYSVGVYHAGVGWNTQKVTPQEEASLEKITSWDQIVNPAFKGRTIMGDIRSGGFEQLVYYFLRERYGEQFWLKLRDNLAPVIVEGQNPAAQQVASGEYAFTPWISAEIGIMPTLYLRGAPVRWVYPSPGISIPYFVSISRLAPHLNAAKLFETWALSVPGQTAWVNISGLAPIRKDIVDDRPLAKVPWYKLPKATYQPDYAKIDATSDAMVAEFKKVFGR